MRSSFFLLFLCISFTAFAQHQDVKQNIANEFTDYQEAIAAGEFEKAMDYILPEFFGIYPKADLLKVMEQSFNNPDIDFEITNLKIEEIETPEKVEEKHYALLTYSNQMNIRFQNQEEQTEEEKKSQMGKTLISLAQTFGSNNVTYDPSSDFFQVRSEKKVYAISDNGNTNWKFLAVEKGQKEILEKLLPAEITRKM